MSDDEMIENRETYRHVPLLLRAVMRLMIWVTDKSSDFIVRACERYASPQ